MPEFQPPADPREVHLIPHATHVVYVVRCWPVDCNALADWCDSVLGRDFFFKRRHLESILERRNNGVWSIVCDDVCSGLVILYDGSILHNLYVDPTLRKSGIGSAVLQFFRPTRIRSKTNMLAGDPTEFYLRNGYVVDQPDPTRPHILDMVLPQGSADCAQPNGAGAPSNNGRPTARTSAESRVPAGDAAALGPAVGSGASAKAARPNGVGLPSAASADAVGPVATPSASGPPSLDDSGFVTLTLTEYNALATLSKNRKRIADYRAKRKAEKLAAAGK